MDSQKHFPRPDHHPLIFIDPDINYGHPSASMPSGARSLAVVGWTLRRTWR